MLAQDNPLGVIAASFLFGMLNAGSAVLQMETGLSKYLVEVLQFVMVLVLAAQFTWKRTSLKRSSPSPPSPSSRP